MILGAVAVLLSWVGISIFKSDSASTPAASEGTANSQARTPPPVGEPHEAATRSAKVEPKSTDAKPVEPEVRPQPDAPPSAIKEVLPDVSQSALNTVRGTIRVSVRVTVGKDGTVLAATAAEPGPSRYFERHAVAASKKWTFTRANSAEQRIMLVNFNFTRNGTTASASPPQ